MTANPKTASSPATIPERPRSEKERFLAWWEDYMPVRTIGRDQDNFIQCAWAAWNAARPILTPIPDRPLPRDAAEAFERRQAAAREKESEEMNEPTRMEERPKVESFTYYSAEGNPHQFIVGQGATTEIRETQEYGEFALIPWLEVWEGNALVARFNQHKVEHIFYRRA